MGKVVSYEEEWRTSTLRRQTPLGGKVRVSYGRVCLWSQLECGHYNQIMRPLDKNGDYKPPVRAKCDECDVYGESEEP